MKKLVCLLLTCLLLGTSALAAESSQYKDVPADFWAKHAIDLLASGGLMSGYGNGVFGPNDPFTIDQMATVIANVKGQSPSQKDGYWAYGAIDYCLNTLKCLPNFGAITKDNYGKACSRELAIYMLMTGLGPKSEQNYHTVDPAEIPDYADITTDYRDMIIKAYSYNITTGVDKTGTFHPQEILTRAQIATMLYRVGYTTAAVKISIETNQLTNPQLFEKIKALGIWEYSERNSVKYLRATSPKYGGLEVKYSTSSGLLYISTPEQNRDVWFNGRNQVDVNGKVVSDELNSKGVMVCSTGFGYEARQLLLQILKIVYPNDYLKAYEASKITFLQQAFEYGGSEYASTIRWIDGRMWISLLTSYPARTFEVLIGEANDVEMYNECKDEAPSGMHRDFAYQVGADSKAATAYEYDRW